MDNKGKSVLELMAAGAAAGAMRAVDNAIASGVPLAVWENDQVVFVSIEELKAYKASRENAASKT